MYLYNQLVNRETKLSLLGLGYVGMPIAVVFVKEVDIIGFDLNKEKIAIYKQGINPTLEEGGNVIIRTPVDFTADAARVREAKFHIMAVPTPVNPDHAPNLTLQKSASTLLGRNLMPGSVIVFKSTVYPGVTEEICVPILEQESSLICGRDFKVGYSPKRINPGDQEHRLGELGR